MAWEIARRGNRVEANDISAAMLVAARSIMLDLRSAAAGELRRLHLHPRVRCASGVVHRAACLSSCEIPDVETACARRSATPAGAVSAAAALTLQAASWADAHAPPPRHGAAPDLNATFDSVVTSYFVDTQADPAATVRRVHSLLAPGGVWINVGPLHWHEPSAGLLRLTLDELLALVELHGFEIRSLRRLRRVPYVGSPSPSPSAMPSLFSFFTRTGSKHRPWWWEEGLGEREDTHDVVFWECVRQ